MAFVILLHFRTIRSREVEEGEGLREGEAGGWTIAEAEIHWYDAHGIGRRWIKIKRYRD